VMVGTGVGAQMGILIKGGKALEVGYNVSTICFDKTGTLTFGRPACLGVDPVDEQSYSMLELMRLIIMVERGSEHPIARSLLQHAEEWLDAHADDEQESGGESKRLVVESPWSQFTSECQRF
jgi:P-type Cu+ transporter